MMVIDPGQKNYPPSNSPLGMVQRNTEIPLSLHFFYATTTKELKILKRQIYRAVGVK
jgi:hypothetical protein